MAQAGLLITRIRNGCLAYGKPTSFLLLCGIDAFINNDIVRPVIDAPSIFAKYFRIRQTGVALMAVNCGLMICLVGDFSPGELLSEEAVTGNRGSSIGCPSSRRGRRHPLHYVGAGQVMKPFLRPRNPQAQEALPGAGSRRRGAPLSDSPVPVLRLQQVSLREAFPGPEHPPLTGKLQVPWVHPHGGSPGTDMGVSFPNNGDASSY